MFYNKRIFKRCFSYNKKYWYKNLTRIPLYFKLMRYLIKTGYDEYATWETHYWFIITMKSILSEYREHHNGVPILIDKYPNTIITEKDRSLEKENEEMWNSIIDRMIEMLDYMDECNPIYSEMDYCQEEQMKEKAKNEFFALFSKYFYDLWD